MGKEKEITVRLPSFDEKDFTYDNIKDILDEVISGITKNIYYVLSFHSAFKAMKGKLSKKTLNINIAQPQTLQDYENNLIAVKKAVERLEIGFNFANKLKIKKLKNTDKLREEFLEILKEAINFASYSVELSEFADGKNTRDYMKQASVYYGRMHKSLTNMAKLSDYPSLTIERYGEGYKNIFTDLAEYFRLNFELAKAVVSFEREVRKQSEKREKQLTMIEEKSKAVKLPINKAEERRKNLIEKANSYYEEFCMDFLRDLEKQVPLSTRDLYKEFIDVKFAKFAKTFKMPLSDSASEGLATEVIYQINLMIDYIAKIKENSYVTSVYKEKD